MALSGILQSERGAIAAAWMGRIVELFPADSQGFFSEQKNEFANPVGHALSQGTRGIVDALADGSADDAFGEHLYRIAKVLSIQEMPPSRALSFVPELKRVVRETLDRGSGAEVAADEIAALDARIDKVILMAFDAYMECRERIFQLRVEEVKRAVSNHLRRTGFYDDGPEAAADPQSGSDDCRTPQQRGGSR